MRYRADAGTWESVGVGRARTFVLESVLEDAVPEPIKNGDTVGEADPDDLERPALYDTGMTAEDGPWNLS